MPDIDRRRFLRHVALTGAIAAGSGAFPPTTLITPAFADDETFIETPYKAFVAGRILSVNGNTISVNTTEQLVTQVVASSATEIWKGGDVSVSLLGGGDCIYARGVEMNNGQIAAAYIWANIVSFDALVTSSSSSQLVVATADETWVVNMSSTTELFRPNSDTAEVPPGSIAVNSNVHVLGAYTPGANVVSATRIWVGLQE